MSGAMCGKCGSSRVVDDVPVIDRNGDYSDGELSVRIEKNPGAILFKGKEDFPLRARVCCQCGFTELFATRLDELWKAASIARDHQPERK